MHKDAMPKNALWRLLRSMLIGTALMLGLVMLRKWLSFGGTLFFLGFLIVLLLTSLSDRELFYYGVDRSLQQPDDDLS